MRSKAKLPRKSGPVWEEMKRKAQTLANAYNEAVGIYWESGGAGEVGGFKFVLQRDDRPAALFMEKVTPARKGGAHV